LVVTYPSLLFTGYFEQEPEADYDAGWLVIAIVILNIAINISIVAY